MGARIYATPDARKRASGLSLWRNSTTLFWGTSWGPAAPEEAVTSELAISRLLPQSSPGAGRAVAPAGLRRHPGAGPADAASLAAWPRVTPSFARGSDDRMRGS
jgi:hypothetical protein